MYEYDKNRRIVVTGLGIISSLGLDIDEFWNSCLEGKSGIKPFALPGSPFDKIRFAGEVTKFTGNIDEFGIKDNAKKKAIRKGFKLMSREIMMSVAATERALSDANVDSNSYQKNRAGVSFSSDYIITTPDEVLAGMNACREGDHLNFSRWAAEGLTKMTPIWQLKFLTNMPSSHITIYNEFFSFANDITNREASIGAAVGEAVEVIRKNKVDLMVVGATGSRIHPFKLIHTLQTDEIADQNQDPEKACRPFDRDRSGTVPGEGAGAIVLEELEHAKKRGAQIYAEIIDGAYRGAMSFITSPKKIKTVEGNIRRSIVLALQALIRKTGITPDSIGHLNLTGFGSRHGDREEARAIEDVFGDYAKKIPATALKGHFGNPGAGGGALELIAGILALKNNALFPIVNNENCDPECPVLPVREAGSNPGDSFVKVAYQSAGQASALLVKKFK